MQASGAKRNGVLVVGGHPLTRERIRELVNNEPDLRVCGEAESRSEALDIIGRTPTHLVITDLSLKDSHALELVKDIHSRWPQLGILVFSVQDEALYAERVLRAGARGFITEKEATEKLIQALRHILAGEMYMGERIAGQIASQLLGHHSRPTHKQSSIEFLSDRELEVFGWIGQGYSSQEIAARLHIHPKTVETYRARIKERLGIGDAHQLLQHAIRWNKYHSPE